MPRASWSGISSAGTAKISKFAITKLNVVSYARQYVKIIDSNMFLLRSGKVFFRG